MAGPIITRSSRSKEAINKIYTRMHSACNLVIGVVVNRLSPDLPFGLTEGVIRAKQFLIAGLSIAGGPQRGADPVWRRSEDYRSRSISLVCTRRFALLSVQLSLRDGHCLLRGKESLGVDSWRGGWLDMDAPNIATIPPADPQAGAPRGLTGVFALIADWQISPRGAPLANLTITETSDRPVRTCRSIRLWKSEVAPAA